MTGTLAIRRARGELMCRARKLEERTHERQRHGGALRKTGLRVLEILLFELGNMPGAACYPRLSTIAARAQVARSTAQLALKRLALWRFVVWTRRYQTLVVAGLRVVVPLSNLYRFPMLERSTAERSRAPHHDTESRPGEPLTITEKDRRKTLGLWITLDRLGATIRERAELARQGIVSEA